MNEEALARTRETGEMWFWSRSRDRAVAQGGDLGQRAARQGAPLRLRQRRLRRAGGAGRARLPHRASAPASTAATWTRRRREALAGARADDRRAPGRRARRELHRRAAGRSRAASARRSGRRPRRSRARPGRSPTSGSPRRPPTCSTTCGAAGRARAQPRRRLRGAQWPSPLTSSSTPGLDEVRELAREHKLVPLRHTFIADCETPGLRLPQAARRRAVVPARVGRAGAARRALVVPRLPPARDRSG